MGGSRFQQLETTATRTPNCFC